DVAVHADGAAVHHPLDLCRRGRLDQGANGQRVDSAIRFRGYAGLTIDRREVIDDVGISDRARERRRVAHIAGDELDTRRTEIICTTRVAHQRAHCRATQPQRTGEMAAGEPGRAGYEDAHRSATSVTGDPNTRSSP